MARTIAPVFRRLMPHEAAAVRRNLARVLPTAEANGLGQTVHTLFRNFAIMFSDLLSLNRQSVPHLRQAVQQMHGHERLQAALASPRGFMVATAHIGNWDLAGRLLCTYGRAVHVISAPEQQTAVQQLLREHGRTSGLQFVSNQEAGIFVRLLMALRRGDVVAFQADRVIGHRSDTRLPFFGAPAGFPGGLFALAAAAQVQVLPCFCLLRPDQRYDIFVDTPIVAMRGEEEVALRRMVHVLEQYITMAPDQWFNFYDIWDNAATT